MRTASCRNPGSIEIGDAPVPQPEHEGEVLLRVRRCGICGSDLHWYNGESPPPHVCPGHEISAVVESLGPGIHHVGVGDRVAVEGIRGCGTCAACTTGRSQLCPALRVLGMSSPGGFADYLVTDSRHVHRVPDAVDDETAQLTEPLAVGVHALRLADLRPGGRVLVLGAGTIGLLAVAAARAAGASDVQITAKRPHQQAAAAALGASEILEPEAFRGIVSGPGARRFDVVLDTVADPNGSLDDAIAAVVPGGTVVVIGVFTRRPSLDALRLMVLEVRLVGSMCYGAAGDRPDFATALDILVQHGGQLRRHLVTHRVSLDDLAEGFRVAADKQTGSIKVSVAISDETPPGP